MPEMTVRVRCAHQFEIRREQFSCFPAGRPFQAPESRPEVSGSGRVVPEKKAPVQQSGSAHRPQPSRQPRSKRNK